MFLLASLAFAFLFDGLSKAQEYAEISGIIAVSVGSIIAAFKAQQKKRAPAKARKPVNSKADTQAILQGRLDRMTERG